jgi:hypothetical protein
MLEAYLLAGVICAAFGFMMTSPRRASSSSGPQLLGSDELKPTKGKGLTAADLSGLQESTRVPSGTCSDDDKETHWTRDSGSTNRTNRQKGSGRVKKLQERAAKHRKSEGIEDFPKNANDRLAGGVALREKMKKEDLMSRLIKSDRELARIEGTLSRHIANRSVPADLIFRGNFCTCCEKEADQWHVGSATHTSREMVIRGLNHMLGPVRWRKLYQGYEPPAGSKYISKRRIEEFWGDEIALFALRALEVIKHEGFITTKASKSGKAFQIPAAAIRSATVALVPYSGAGKYENSSAVKWCNLPEDEHNLDGKSSMVDLQLQAILPGQSWWPVAILDVDPSPEFGQQVMWTATCGLLLATCIHQAIVSPIWAWFIDETGFVELPDDPEWVD